MATTDSAIADRLEIADLLTAYAVAVDTGAWEDLDEVFTPDAQIDYRGAGGIAGRLPEIKAWLAETLPRFVVRQHLITNVQVDFADGGDTAQVGCYLYNPMGHRDDAGTLSMFFVGGGYADTVLRTATGWRISHRVHRTDWMWAPTP